MFKVRHSPNERAKRALADEVSVYNFNSLSIAPKGLKLSRSVIVIFDEPKLRNLGIDEDTQGDGYGGWQLSFS